MVLCFFFTDRSPLIQDAQALGAGARSAKRMGGWLSSLFSAFYSRQLEVVLVGLENSGKTTLLNVLATGTSAETVPTIGLNVKVVKKGKVTMKCWDIGGQQQYRSEWGRYTRGCDVIMFVVDAYNVERIADARRELHRLLEDRCVVVSCAASCCFRPAARARGPSRGTPFPIARALRRCLSLTSSFLSLGWLGSSELASTPVLVLANKIDLKPHISEHDLIRELNLEYCCDNPWLVIPCSALQQVNIDQVVDWLVHQGK